jgi:hypothetical protein
MLTDSTAEVGSVHLYQIRESAHSRSDVPSTTLGEGEEPRVKNPHERRGMRKRRGEPKLGAVVSGSLRALT